MSLLARPMTYDELSQIPDDGNRYELIGGELIVAPAPTVTHQMISSRLHLLIGNHVVARDMGVVVAAPVDVQLSLHNNVQPDLLFIRSDRIEQLDGGAAVEGPPDLVVEIISPSSRGMDRIRKAATYADAGVPEYWLVDPMERTIEVLMLQQGRYVPVEANADGRLASAVIPGLTVDPEPLFARLRS